MARFGQNAMGIGSELYAAETHRQDQIRLLDADRQAGQLENQLMYHPETGALNVRGKDTLALPDTVGKAWDEQTGKIRQGLANDRQRIAFDQQTVTTRQRMMDRLDGHITEEIHRVDGEALEGKVENETEAALADPLPENVQRRLNNIDQAYDDFGGRYRIDPQYTAAAKAKARSRVHVGVIQRMLKNGDDINAQVTYDHFQKEILGKDLGEIEGGLHEGSMRGQSQRIADDIVNGNRKGATGDEPPTLAELREQVKVRTEGNPELRDRIEARVEAIFAKDREDERIAKERQSEIIVQQLAADKARREQEKEQHAQLVDKIIPNLIDQNKSKDVHTMLDAIDPTIWANMTAKEREATETYATRQAKGEEVKTDFGTYYNLLALSSSDATRNDFAKTNLNDPVLLNRISTADLKHLAEIQNAIRKGDGKSADKLTEGFRTTGEMVNDSMRLTGLDPNAKNGTDDARRKAQLHQAVDQDIADFEHRNGKKPTRTDIQGFIDQHLIKGTATDKGWFWDSQTQKFSIDVPTGEPFAIQFNQIPKDEVRKAEEALARAGKPESEAIIEQMYLAKIRKQKPAVK